MLIASKPESMSAVAAFPDSTDLKIDELLAAIEGHREKPLVFFYGGRPVKAGYHVTEVKAGHFSTLDCGANPESWSEIFIQLWDVDEGEPVHMPAGKFAAIIRKVTEHVQLEDAAQLTFEVSDGSTPIQLHKAAMPVIEEGKNPHRSFAAASKLQAAGSLASCAADRATSLLWNSVRHGLLRDINMTLTIKNDTPGQAPSSYSVVFDWSL